MLSAPANKCVFDFREVIKIIQLVDSRMGSVVDQSQTFQRQSLINQLDKLGAGGY